MWPETIKMSNAQLASYITDQLERLGIAPMHFNAGLWALGWYGRGAMELLLERRISAASRNKPQQKQQELTFKTTTISKSTRLRTTSEKRQFELDGKYAVLEQLKSMGHVGSLTLDYHPRIVAYNPKNGKRTTIWVKTTKDKTLFPIGKMTREQMRTRFTVPAVFVRVYDDGTKRFYVLAPNDIPYLIEKGYDWWLKEVSHRKEFLAPFEEQSQGILIRFLHDYENQWKKLGLD